MPGRKRAMHKRWHNPRAWPMPRGQREKYGVLLDRSVVSKAAHRDIGQRKRKDNGTSRSKQWSDRDGPKSSSESSADGLTSQILAVQEKRDVEHSINLEEAANHNPILRIPRPRERFLVFKPQLIQADVWSVAFHAAAASSSSSCSSFHRPVSVMLEEMGKATDLDCSRQHPYRSSCMQLAHLLGCTDQEATKQGKLTIQRSRAPLHLDGCLEPIIGAPRLLIRTKPVDRVCNVISSERSTTCHGQAQPDAPW